MFFFPFASSGEGVEASRAVAQTAINENRRE
jgi:hypothetical protein